MMTKQLVLISVSVAHRIIVKFLCKENVKTPEIFERHDQQYAEVESSK